LSLVAGHSLINKVFSNCITGERYKFHILNTLKVRSQLSLNKCGLAHPWNTNRHDNYDSFLFVTSACHLINELHRLNFIDLLGNLWSVFRHIIDLDLLLGLTL
jgi:hypothetical protein